VLLAHVLNHAAQAAAAWGDAVPEATREYAVNLCRRRLSLAGLAESSTAA
jgi:hypothetical protein